jgi:hypothetical protein
LEERKSHAQSLFKKNDKREKKKEKNKTKTRWERGRIILSLQSLQSPIKKICDGNDHPLHDKHQFNSTITKPSQVIFD